MSAPDADRATFLRDALLVTILAGVALGLYRTYLGPSLLWLPGQSLYLPLVFVYTVLGGVMENQQGPSTLLLVAYVVGLGLAGATAARLGRRHLRMERRHWLLALLGVGGTVALIAGLFYAPVVGPATLLGGLVAAAVVLVGLLAVLVVRG